MRRIKSIFNTIICAALIHFAFHAYSEEPYLFVFHDPDWGFESSSEALEAMTKLVRTFEGPMGMAGRVQVLKVPQGLNATLGKTTLAIVPAIFALNHPELEPLVLPIRSGSSTERKVMIGRPEVSPSSQSLRLAVPKNDSDLDRFLGVLSPAFQKSQIGSVTPVVSAKAAALAVLYNAADLALTTVRALEEVRVSKPELIKGFKTFHSDVAVPNSLLCAVKGKISQDKVDALIQSLIKADKDPQWRKIAALSGIDAWERVDRPQLTAMLEGTPSAKAAEAEKAPEPPQKPPEPEMVASLEQKPQPKAPEPPPVIKMRVSAKADPQSVRFTAKALSEDRVVTGKIRIIWKVKDKQGRIETQPGRKGDFTAALAMDEIRKLDSSPRQEQIYVIKRNDNLWRIAERTMGTSKRFATLVKYNNIENPNIIIVGQELRIPSDVVHAVDMVYWAELVSEGKVLASSSKEALAILVP